MSERLKEGDEVVLKTGSVPMTIGSTHSNGETAVCFYTDQNGEPTKKEISTAALKRVEKQSSYTLENLD